MSADKSYLFGHWWYQLASDTPAPVSEYKFCDTRRWRFDWAFVQQKIAVEVDGGVWLKFGGRHGGDRDREKMNAAAELGWRVFRYSPAMIESNPFAVVEQVRRAL